MRTPGLVISAGVLAWTGCLAQTPRAEAYSTDPLGYSLIVGTDRSVMMLEVSPEIRLLWTYEAPFQPIDARVAVDGSRVALLNSMAVASRDPGAPALILLDRRGRATVKVSFATLFDQDRFPQVPRDLFWYYGVDLDEKKDILVMSLVPPRGDWAACLEELEPGERDQIYRCIDEERMTDIELDCDTGEFLLRDGAEDEDSGEVEDESD